MTRWRLLAWIAGLAVLLAGVLIVSVYWPAGSAYVQTDEDILIDRMLDRLGVTQQSAVLSWLSDDSGESPDNPPVWVARNGRHFHGYPLCPGLKAPMETTYWEAKAFGYAPCPVCCAALKVAEEAGEG